jgi:hypothetical protein
MESSSDGQPTAYQRHLLMLWATVGGCETELDCMHPRMHPHMRAGSHAQEKIPAKGNNTAASLTAVVEV